MAPPISGKQPAPLDPIHLDRRTVAELARLLSERLAQVQTYGGACRTCRDGEAEAFLAKLRNFLDAIDGRA